MGFIRSIEKSFVEASGRKNLRDGILSFGVQFLDDAMLGILKNDLILVGAASGGGKTQFCCNVALANVAKVKELGEKAKYFDAIYDKALEKASEIIKSLTYEKDELLNELRTENERYLRLQEDSEECAKVFRDSFGIDCEAGDLFGTRKVRGDEYKAVNLKVKKV